MATATFTPPTSTVSVVVSFSCYLLNISCHNVPPLGRNVVVSFSCYTARASGCGASLTLPSI